MCYTFAFTVLCHVLLTAVLSTHSRSTENVQVEKCGYVMVDLSHEVVQGVPRAPIFQDLGRENFTFKLAGENNFEMYENLCLATHVGTHMDAPCHRIIGAWCLDDIPFERLVMVPAVVINVTSKVFPPNSDPQRDYLITVQDILDWEAKYGQEVPAGGVVLFHTGWPRYWNDPALFLGGNTPTTMSYPGLAPNTSKWLVENRSKLYGVGTDSLAIDYGKSPDLMSHNYLSNGRMYILESLTNLDLLPATGTRINIGVMKLGNDASGAPARIFAMYSRSSPLHDTFC